MCGIFFSIVQDGRDAFLAKPQLERIYDALRCRGPDCSNQVVVQLSEQCKLTFFSTVLSMRDPLTVQPLQSATTSSVLQFNGEIYDVAGELEGRGRDLLVDETELDEAGCSTVCSSRNDTSVVMHLFEEFGVLKTVQCLRGEYAFVYYDAVERCVWWARDCIGRRSLLMNQTVPGELALSSVAPFDAELCKDWIEVPGGSVYKIDLSAVGMPVTSFPWRHASDDLTDQPCLIYPYPEINPSVSVSDDDNSSFLSQFESSLHAAVKRRVLAINQTAHSNYAVLFSGGIDCTVLTQILTTILHDHHTTIDLLNVAFENPRTGGGYATPDRLLGRRSFEELLGAPGFANAQCVLRFVEIDVPFALVQEYKSQVAELMYPKTSVMDFSIALAFFFAARGVGRVVASSAATDADLDLAKEYSTPSRVLFSGLGADELYAGYSRHTAGFRRQGYQSLAAELALDFGRLHERNLGRDDRVGACWGKELRYPFLDEDFVNFSLSCPLNYKMRASNTTADDGSITTSITGKYLIRQYARKVGLPQVAEESKRAIQFGARSAKMEVGTGKVKGTDTFK
ncbi:asparagine synthetase domain-containing protein 1 [Myxozyma melibiosi]|uniref:Asparagine synthetase domain-containing protein 1 n=1 Tax=Myxozyma melibiosi TaxID=54550 RepID=A0ABR1F163_9ASCO